MVERFQGSGTRQQGGFLATHKQDFNAHVTGGDWRHTADQIDMNPVLSQFPADTVQGTLELLGSFAATQGSGFISIGNTTSDGYATGSYNVTDSVDFETALSNAFQDGRLTNGGIILIMAGTYRMSNTVTVPAGITLMGEIAGTVISGDMGEVPMFRFQSGQDLLNIGGDSGAGEIPLEVGAPIDESRLMNIVLVDNLDGYVTSGGLPVSSMQTTPMVVLETSARLHCYNVKFVGRINNGTVAGRNKTLRAIGTVSGGSDSTHLTVERCFFDGMETAIRFEPQNGSLDHLTLLDNRARVFGTEDLGAIDASDNCFVSFSFCNLQAKNNYVIGAGTFGTQNVGTCFVIRSVGGGSDTSMLISGTTGGPSSGAEGVHSVFFNETSTAAKVITLGNNWASDAGIRWFITVGDGSTAGDGFAGDFVGSGAIDLVLNTSFEYPANVYVLPGTYTVTNNGNALYNFIGVDLPNTDAFPVINLNLSSAPTDEAGNDIFNCGQQVRNLEFGVISDWTSIRPGGSLGGTKSAEIRNCKFTNVGLSINNSGNSSFPNRVEVDNCFFNQDGTFDDNINWLIPTVDNVIIKNTTVTGNGYAGLIGNDATISYTTTFVGNFLIENCLFDQIGSTIQDASPLGIEAFLVINDGNGKCTLQNNRFVVADGNQVAGIASDTRVTNGFSSYVNLIADVIHLENNQFNLPYRTYQESGTNYILPGLFLNPSSTVRLKSSYFYNCLCQIGTGANTALNSQGDGILVEDCFFIVNDNDYGAAAVLDIDVDPPADTVSGRKIIITKNSFYTRPSTDVPIFPFHNESGAYTTLGVVQIFSDGVPVFVSDNFMDANLPTFNGEIAQTVLAGFLINNKSVDNVLLPALQISGNDLYVINNYTSGVSTEVCATVYVDCTNLQVSDNEITMDNSAGVAGSNLIQTLYVLTNNNAGGENPIKALVTGNNFSRRRKTSGAAVSLTAFVGIDGLSEPGLLTDNVFSDDTTDGTDETLVNDDSSSWSSYNNVNEFYTITTNGEIGMFGVSNAGAGDLFYPVVGDDNGPGLQSYIIVDLDGIGTRVTFAYNSGDGRVVFKWYISLNGIIPWGANVTDVEVAVDATANPATLDDVRLLLLAGGGSAQDTSNITTAGDTLSISNSTVRTGSGSENYVMLEAILESGGNLNVFTTGALTIKYKL